MDPIIAWDAVQSWPAADRLAFAVRLWDDAVGEGFQPEPSEELTAELDARLDAHEADPTNVMTWEQVVERVRGRGQLPVPGEPGA